MALQHFYSRVPARVSMYHKVDGFDTFAQSAGLDPETVERELVPLCENKLNKVDTSLIRQNKMPSIYTQCTTRTGNLVQGCISYLPVDYTGERSAYLAHSLVLSPEEKEKVLSTSECNAINTTIFVKNMDSFPITAPTAVPEREYPTKDYTPSKVENNEYMLSGFPEETVEAFLFSVLSSLCGKGKNVCVKLPGSGAALSQSSTQLFNELLSVLPRQLRSALSFCSYVTDPAQYNGYKLRGVSSDFPENAVKGIYIDFETNLIVGVRHDEVVANQSLIRFFCQLLDNQTLRSEFLQFMERAAAAIPALQSMNLKVLGSLVFLFQCSCGLFPEMEILPNDGAVLDYLCAYEKYRDALCQTHRMQGYQCLMRYIRNHQAIPKNIFAKVTRLYGAEDVPVKRIVMDVVLELIHTDTMRDKLFAFIRSNYAAEEQERKRAIITDLTRVFYGGFLQSQLLSFFSEQFQEASEETRTLILEKLLLSIRTPAVQGKILALIQRHYGSFSEAHKDLFYHTFIEMLPECDELADLLIEAVNQTMEGETEARRTALASQILPVLEYDCRRKDRKMMPMLAEHPGFSQDLALKLLFGPWRTWKVHGEYMTILSEKTAEEKMVVLSRVFALIPETDAGAVAEEAITLFQKDLEQGDLYLWLWMEEQLSTLPEAFSTPISTTIVEPAVAKNLTQVFETVRCADGMARLEAYRSRHPAVGESEEYRIISSYNSVVSAAIGLDYPELERQLQLLLEYPEQLSQIANYIKECDIHPESQSQESVLCLTILQNLLSGGGVDVGRLYRKCAENRTAEEAMLLLLSVCCPMSEGGPNLVTALTASESGMKAFVSGFVQAYGKGAYHRLRDAFSQENPFGKELEGAIRSHKKENGSFLSKLFGKK